MDDLLLEFLHNNIHILKIKFQFSYNFLYNIIIKKLTR